MKAALSPAGGVAGNCRATVSLLLRSTCTQTQPACACRLAAASTGRIGNASTSLPISSASLARSAASGRTSSVPARERRRMRSAGDQALRLRPLFPLPALLWSRLFKPERDGVGPDVAQGRQTGAPRWRRPLRGATLAGRRKRHVASHLSAADRSRNRGGVHRRRRIRETGRAVASAPRPSDNAEPNPRTPATPLGQLRVCQQNQPNCAVIYVGRVGPHLTLICGYSKLHHRCNLEVRVP